MYGQAFSRAKHGAKNCFDGPKNGPLQLNEGQSSINMPSPPAHPIMILISVMSIDFHGRTKKLPDYCVMLDKACSSHCYLESWRNTFFWDAMKFLYSAGPAPEFNSKQVLSFTARIHCVVQIFSFHLKIASNYILLRLCNIEEVQCYVTSCCCCTSYFCNTWKQHTN